MRSALKGVFVGVVVVALFGAIATRLGWIVASPPRPQGTGAWMLSRATGLLAYMVLSIDVVVGLLVSTRSADRLVQRGQLVDVHGWLSPLALAFVLVHGGVLLADRYVQFDAIDVFVPFASNRWPIAIGIGVFAGYLLLVVHLSFGLRKRIGTAMWRRIHYLSFVAFALVTVHAIAAGTDRRTLWFAAVYAAAALATSTLVGVRIMRRYRSVD
jgi:predicted ferric reductase